MKRTKPRPYWDSLSLEELAEQQGVTPAANLQEAADFGSWTTIPTNGFVSSLRSGPRAERCVRRSIRTMSHGSRGDGHIGRQPVALQEAASRAGNQTYGPPPMPVGHD